jgi:hypothetical protein
MAKFKNLSLDLETGERIDFDDDDTITMGYDGSELYVNSTISGVRAAQPYHMVRYDQLTQASGTLVNYIDAGLEAQDEFIELIDTPPAYAGYAGYSVVVNNTEDGLIFQQTTSTGTTPPASGTGQNLWFNEEDATLYYWDDMRLHWLTVYTNNYLFARGAAVDGSYLAIGDVTHSSAYYYMPRQGVITGLAINAENSQNSSKTFEIRNNSTTLLSVTCSNWEYRNFDLDVDVSDNYALKCYAISDGLAVRNPVAVVEIRWKYVEP